jgi:hypothetical protein
VTSTVHSEVKAAESDQDRKRRAKRNALLLGLVSVGVYVLFIAMTILGK